MNKDNNSLGISFLKKPRLSDQNGSNQPHTCTAGGWTRGSKPGRGQEGQDMGLTESQQPLVEDTFHYLLVILVSSSLS